MINNSKISRTNIIYLSNQCINKLICQRVGKTNRNEAISDIKDGQCQSSKMGNISLQRHQWLQDILEGIFCRMKIFCYTLQFFRLRCNFSDNVADIAKSNWRCSLERWDKASGQRTTGKKNNRPFTQKLYRMIQKIWEISRFYDCRKIVFFFLKVLGGRALLFWLQKYPKTKMFWACCVPSIKNLLFKKISCGKWCERSIFYLNLIYNYNLI
jgi:hypothetical protein